MTLTVKIDEYVELVGIIAYLQGNFLCQKDKKKDYMKDADEYFCLYKKHPIIKKCAAFAIDKLVFMATLLEYKKGKFILKKEQENKCINFSKDFLQNLDELLEGLADFYKISCFHKFFLQHKDFYAQICSYCEKSVQFLNTDWFRNFLGDEEGHLFFIVPFPILLHENYGFCRHVVGGVKEHIAVLGQSGFQTCRDNQRSFEALIVYEYLHSFINPLLYGSIERQKKLETVGTKVLDFSRWTMKQQGYTDWCMLMNEYLVRALTNVYMQENGFTKQDIRRDIMTNIERGFYLMPELVGYINKYRYCRDKFKAFEEFYSEIAKFFSSCMDREIRRVDDVVNVILEV